MMHQDKRGQHADLVRRQRVSVSNPLESQGQESASTPIVSTPSTPASSRQQPPLEPSSDPVETPTRSTETVTSTSISVDDPSQSTPSRSSSVPLSSQSLATSAVVRGSSTSFVTNIVTVGAPALSSSSSSAPSSGSGGSGPSAGMVVGVVAGSLVGIVVVAGLIGYFFKTKFGDDKDDDIDDTVFNKNDFRHSSVMLQDDDLDRMSMRSGSAAGTLNAAGVGRSGPGAQRNASPFDRHLYNASPVQRSYPEMPSFQPGQIVNSNFYSQPNANYAPSDGGWGVAASYAQAGSGQNAREHLQPAHAQPQTAYYGNASLERAASQASHYPDEQYGNALDRQPSYANHTQHDYPPARSGSPVNSNQQQYWTEGSLNGGSSQQRGLSVRNNGRSYGDESVYGGAI